MGSAPMVPLRQGGVYLSRRGLERLAKPSQQKSSTATAQSVRSRYPISVITMVSPPDRSHRIEYEFVASARRLSEQPITPRSKFA